MCSFVEYNQRRLFHYQRWMMDSISIGQTIHAKGWAMCEDPENAEFMVNDQITPLVEYPLQCDDLVASFGLIPASSMGRFELMGEKLREGELVKLSFIPKGADSETVENNAWYFPVGDTFRKLPSEEEMGRVILGQSGFAFLLGGATLYGRLTALLARKLGLRFDSFERVLDWGSGAGRLTRFLLSPPGARLCGKPEVHGIDIDDVNIRWCKANLPGGHFYTISPSPPTTYPDGFFDLVFGISVMTHLREIHQNSWLEELYRITRPGALLLLSIQGPTIHAFNHVPESVGDMLRRTGFVVTGDNNQIDCTYGDSQYYVDVIHSQDYIRRVWGTVFEVVDIIDAVAANQDLVILRRR